MVGWRTGTVAVVVAVASVAVGVPDAVARQAADPCGGQGYAHVVRLYRRGGARLPLRCGTSTWGYRHITHRWSADFDRRIALTISRGVVVQDVQGDGGTAIYALFDRRCKELFRVIYNGGAYRGHDVRPQGIITAYRRDIAHARLAAPSRRPCAVIQDI
ncbi:hypothetical protein DZF91_21725 [Actinomadura logoneensis]|uniref:Uncharacterized protein n=1 Tax=Actinomadura logoneensis TaxID=2293572 RepID=A0A372JHX7_9ACTN|nr:hypothetical protein [Actinomadura logoneensis]RFU39560.1 hypothetical protein DZF91_21725 [Actinomadura logoneensis]